MDKKGLWPGGETAGGTWPLSLGGSLTEDLKAFKRPLMKSGIISKWSWRFAISLQCKKERKAWGYIIAKVIVREVMIKSNKSVLFWGLIASSPSPSFPLASVIASCFPGSLLQRWLGGWRRWLGDTE